MLVKVVNRSYINVMRFREMLIYCVKLDHALYSINYGIFTQFIIFMGRGEHTRPGCQLGWVWEL